MTEETEAMDDEEWIRFVWLNKPALIAQIRARIPRDIKFIDIDPGGALIIFLKRLHGNVPLNFLALKVALNDQEDIREIQILWPAGEDSGSPV
jgi:hypothetical protein